VFRPATAPSLRLRPECFAQRTLTPVVVISALLVPNATDRARADDDVRPHAGMLRYADVSATHVVFVYANDLWLVPREGGLAVPLASPPGEEAFPRFSPDGRTIAFVGNYDGNRDLYTIPVAGGVPTRVTHHPSSENLCDWTPDGRLLFFAFGMGTYPRAVELFTVASAGGLPEKLPVPYGANAAISPDGQWLAYTPHSHDQRTWKRYRGGMATDIWLFNLKNHTSRKITDWEGTDSQPMWHGQRVYYMSDAGPNHRLDIWMYDTATSQRKQITKATEYDVKWPATGPGPKGRGEIIYQYGPDLYLLDLETEQARKVDVTIPGDLPKLRPQFVDVSKSISNIGISPSGKRAVLEARGDIWTLPAKEGTPRNLTRTSGAAERDPSWSTDGRWVAYFSDATGEYELYITQSDGKGETRQLTKDGSAFRFGPTWSPDSKHIVFTDKTLRLYLHTVETGETKHIDTDDWGGFGRISWAPDSGWLAYTKAGPNMVGAIWLYDVRTGEKQQVTGGVFHCTWPTFDRKGEYLYYASNRDFSDPVYEDVGNSFAYANTDRLLVVPLRKDVKNPLAPKSDEEEWDKKKNDEKKDGDKEGAESRPSTQPQDASGAESKPAEGEGERKPEDEKNDNEKKHEEKEEKPIEPIKIDLDGFEQRSLLLPVKRGSFTQLAVSKSGHLLYLRQPLAGAGGDASLKILDLSADEKEEKTVVESADTFRMSADGKKILVRKDQKLAIVDPKENQKLDKPIALDALKAEISPREEWRQIFHEAWRIQRDFFYDPHMHGLDWKAVRSQYETMLADCVSREDVSYVIREMIAELNVGHAYYWGGDVENPPSVSVGMLGCDFEHVAGGTDEGGAGEGGAGVSPAMGMAQPPSAGLDGPRAQAEAAVPPAASQGGASVPPAYRIKKIYTGAPWDADARGPLRQSGVDVNEGDYLLAVNGVPVDPSKDPWAAFQGLADKTVTLTVSSKPQRDADARDVVVKLLPSESDLRFRAWVEKNRQYVADKTDGKVGYIYVPNTGTDGQNELFRQFYSQVDKAALIIDERWNGGGQIPTRFIELLNRPITNYWARRDGRDWPWPPDSQQGPKCMLINGLAGSGGDMFPWLFRYNRLGKLIGTRTWGGLVGISGNPGLIDGGYTSAPTFAFYEKDGSWGVEGHGVDPDLEVIDDPARMLAGADPQLDAAIALMLQEIDQNGYTPPKRPPYPDRRGMGIKDVDK